MKAWEVLVIFKDKERKKSIFINELVLFDYISYIEM